MNTLAMRIRSEYVGNAAEALASAYRDPRAANCRGFLADGAGKVIGIHLVHVPVPSAMYELALAELIDEYAAGGNTVVTVTVLNSEGLVVAERAMMAWPFPELNAQDSPCGAGNPQNQFAITSKFPENVVGPLAFAVYDADKQLISDVIGGYGQVLGRGHISGRVTFKQRAGVTPPGPDPEPEPEPGSLGRIETLLARLTAHLGA